MSVSVCNILVLWNQTIFNIIAWNFIIETKTSIIFLKRAIKPQTTLFILKIYKRLFQFLRVDQCATAWCSSGNDGYVHLWLHVHIQVTLGNLQKMHSFVSWKSISLQCPIPTTALGLLPCNQGGYTEESQTRCLLVLVVHKPKFGHSLSPSALRNWFSLL